jgi:integrase
MVTSSVGEFAEDWIERYPRPKDSSNLELGRIARRIAADREPLDIDGLPVVLPDLPLENVSRAIARAYWRRHPSRAKVLRAMYGDAVLDGLVEHNPFVGHRVPRSRGRADLVPVTPEEVATLCDLALELFDWWGPELRAVVLTAAYTGVRPGELIALQVQDLDPERGEIAVERRLYAGYTDVPKGGAGRIVVAPAFVFEALECCAATGPDSWLFHNRIGERLGADSLKRAWARLQRAFQEQLPARRRVELHRGRRKEGMDLYELRHFCATYLRDSGVAKEDAAYQLGHADSGGLLERVYAHPSEERTRDRLRAALNG